ncbi:MAG: chemotaxis protein CheW, partial [Actinobacteria bacterium]|nr:chemotaxis protein CheW [Actinomycetota bacterium]
VSFEIGEDTFLIPIERVVEFRIWSEPTAIPHSPEYVRGIVNIRGEIVPIYDVAARLKELGGASRKSKPKPRQVSTKR